MVNYGRLKVPRKWGMGYAYSEGKVKSLPKLKRLERFRKLNEEALSEARTEAEIEAGSRLPD